MVGTGDIGWIVFSSLVEFVIAEDLWGWPGQPAFQGFEHPACREQKDVHVVADGACAEQAELVQPRMI